MLNWQFELEVLSRLMFCVGIEEDGEITSRVVLNITFNYEAVRKAANLVLQAGLFNDDTKVMALYSATNGGVSSAWKVVYSHATR